jgi:phycocyanobilin lyase subunit beta
MIAVEPTQTLIRAVEAADSPASLFKAIRNLADAGDRAAIPTLIAALGFNNPGVAVIAVDGLIAIGEPAVVPLLELLDGYNYGARAWGIRAMAGLGDIRALETLLDAAKNDFSLSVRRAATRGLGTLRWQQVPFDQVRATLEQILQTLFAVTTDSEWVVRYAAITSLHKLAAISILGPIARDQIQTHFDSMLQIEQTPTIIARIWWAQLQLLQRDRVLAESLLPEAILRDETSPSSPGISS